MPQASPTPHPSEHPIDTGARGASQSTPRTEAAAGAGQTRPSDIGETRGRGALARRRIDHLVGHRAGGVRRSQPDRAGLAGLRAQRRLHRVPDLRLAGQMAAAHRRAQAAPSRRSCSAAMPTDTCCSFFSLRSKARGSVRRLTWLGSELCDYNAPLLAEDFSQRLEAVPFVALWRKIIHLLRLQPRFRFDLIDLQKMPETIGAQRNPFLHSCDPAASERRPHRDARPATGSSSTRRNARPRPASASAASSSISPSTAKCASSTCRTATISRARSTS